MTASPTPATGDVLPDMSGGMAHYIRDYFRTLKSLLDAVDAGEIEAVVELLVDTYQNDRRLVLCGNGGSGLAARTRTDSQP